MACTITVGTNSWVTMTEANTFFEGRIKSSEYWIEDADDNCPALVTAYKWLQSGKYSFPATVVQAMKDAQCEMAFFLLQHQSDLDLRVGLRVQGVIAAGVVKEKYRNDKYMVLPIPPIVKQLLGDYDTEKALFKVNLERNEEEGVDYDAFTNLIADEEAD